jgi:hypothetical protein
MEKLEKLKMKIGSIPRVLFYPTYSFIENYLDLQKKASKTPLIHVELNKVGVSNVGETFKFFAAPFIRKGATTSRSGATMKDDQELSIYQFRCLSDQCKILLAGDVQLPKNLDFILQIWRPHRIVGGGGDLCWPNDR